jgi:hypothetical protein
MATISFTVKHGIVEGTGSAIRGVDSVELTHPHSTKKVFHAYLDGVDHCADLVGACPLQINVAQPILKHAAKRTWQLGMDASNNGGDVGAPATSNGQLNVGNG